MIWDSLDFFRHIFRHSTNVLTIFYVFFDIPPVSKNTFKKIATGKNGFDKHVKKIACLKFLSAHQHSNQTYINSYSSTNLCMMYPIAASLMTVHLIPFVWRFLHTREPLSVTYTSNSLKKMIMGWKTKLQKHSKFEVYYMKLSSVACNFCKLSNIMQHKWLNTWND